jgi:hypothetical protein
MKWRYDVPTLVKNKIEGGIKMRAKIMLSVFALLLTACMTPPNQSSTQAGQAAPSLAPVRDYETARNDPAVPTTSYKPIEITAAMKAGISATRPFELVYALEYATARGDKTITETFGGLSSMVFQKKQGGRLTFEIITDQAHFGLLDAPDAMLASPTLSGSSKVSMVPIRGPNGDVLSGANNVDSEGLARTPRGRLVSLERNHRLLSLTDQAAFFGKASSQGPALTGFDGLEPNGGMEALVALTDGRFLASAEYGRGEPGTAERLRAPYWIFGLDQSGPIAPAGYFQNAGNFGITEARVMDNDLWVLKRGFDPATSILRARLERCPLASVVGASVIGASVVGSSVVAGAPQCTTELSLDAPFVMDNYEGMEIFKDPATKDLYFYILSDDNFSPTQRTILLAFKARFDPVGSKLRD